jgi:hypothetical protein
MTQIISGHGCFNGFLYRIGKARSAECAHCDAVVDDVKHTLEECCAWADEREELRNKIGHDLDLRNIIRIIVFDRDKWKSFSKFCSLVMGKKEKAERVREEAAGNPVMASPGDAARLGMDSLSD